MEAVSVNLRERWNWIRFAFVLCNVDMLDLVVEGLVGLALEFAKEVVVMCLECVADCWQIPFGDRRPRSSAAVAGGRVARLHAWNERLRRCTAVMPPSKR
jgi:hypothetical protein